MFFTQEDYRKIEEYLKLNARKDTDFELLDSDLIGSNDVITVVHDTKNRKVSLQDIFLSKVYEDLYELQRREWAEKVAELQDIINSLKINKVHITDTFGDSDIAGVSLKALTSAFNKIWEKLEDITGEVMLGINMVVTPTFFTSEDGCDVHISANTVGTNGIFEKIQFFIDGESIYEDTFKEYVSFDHHLDIKNEYNYVIMCKAKIMGIEYTRQQIITRYNEFYVGSGSTYSDIMNSAHARQLNGTMRHNYDVEFNNGDKLIIVMSTSLRPEFIRADLNGTEIELTEETITIDGKNYVVLTSEAWSAGEYNIDING